MKNYLLIFVGALVGQNIFAILLFLGFALFAPQTELKVVWPYALVAGPFGLILGALATRRLLRRKNNENDLKQK